MGTLFLYSLALHLTHTSKHMAYTLHKGAKEVTSFDEKVFLWLLSYVSIMSQFWALNALHSGLGKLVILQKKKKRTFFDL